MIQGWDKYLNMKWKPEVGGRCKEIHLDQVNVRILQDIRWRQLLVSWKCLAFKEVRIINLDLRVVLGKFFFYKDIVLSMWNYKESSGTVSFQAGEVCTVKANAGESV